MFVKHLYIWCMDRDRPMPSGPVDQPRFGALLRLCAQHARRHVIEAIRAAGFSDLQDAHLVVFQYPVPEGVRPSELARRIRMSRQATNYLITQLEELGYLERRAAVGSDRRLVHLTKRGRRVFEVIFAALRDLEDQWANKAGRQRFDDFIEVLRVLAEDERQTLFDQRGAAPSAGARPGSRHVVEGGNDRPAANRSPAGGRRNAQRNRPSAITKGRKT